MAQTQSTRAAKFTNDLESVAAAVASFGNTLGRVLSDGKVSPSEYLDIIFTAPQVQTIIVLMPGIIKSYPVLEDSERVAAAKYFADQFNIPQDAAEKKIEVTIEEGTKIYNGLSKTIKSVKEIAAVWKKAPGAPAL